MAIFERYLTPQVKKDLKQKMVFVGGARQVGKTTLAESLLKDRRGYLNWDIPTHRERILNNEWPDTELLVLDEIQKYRSWRNRLKGLFDERKRRQRILVTGSARLDYYRYSGDSLQGRYHYLRLHPLSFAELKMSTEKDLLHLLTLGGFPEPFFRSSEVEAKRWSRDYRHHLIQRDLSGLEHIQDIGNLELLFMRLPELVGSPLSVNALREDLQVTHRSVTRWLDIFERVYSLFRLSPFGSPKIRAVKKEQKHYQMDWTTVSDKAFRFENLVAVHLLKWVHFETDSKGRELDLRYFRDVDGREVDFVVLEDRKPILFVECKWNDAAVGKGLNYLAQRFKKCDAWQISAVGKKDYVTSSRIRVAPAAAFLKTLV